MSTTIVKADGSRETFHVHKLKRSLKNAGASDGEIQEVVSELETLLYDGMTTQEIYSEAFKLLQQSEHVVAARYSLRRALFGLGPTGFPFEDFLARMFKEEGYTTKTRVSIVGKCAPHELDVAAYKSDHSFVAEAKFHAKPGIKSDLQVALYSYARLLDLSDMSICAEDICGIKELMVITNTKFTTTAERYAQCVGLTLLSWNYPKENNLHDRIKRTGLYPVTVLQGLSKSQQKALIDRGAIVCRDVVAKPQLLRHTHISAKRTESVLAQARELCKGD